MNGSRMLHKRFSSMFSVNKSILQAIPSGAYTVIQWDTELFDELNEMAIVNPWTFIPKQNGYYFLYTSAILDNLGANDTIYLGVFTNGAINVAEGHERAANAGNDVWIGLSTILPLVTTDFVDVRIFHNFGAPRNLPASSNRNRFYGFRIR